MQSSRFGRRRFPASELYPSFRSTIMACFRLLYFRVLVSRIPSVLLGTSALLVTAFCTEIFQLSIPIGYPYSRERHVQDGSSSSVKLQVPFEGARTEREYRAASDAVHLSPNTSVLEDLGPQRPRRPPYVWEEQRVCGAVPLGVEGSRVMLIPATKSVTKVSNKGAVRPPTPGVRWTHETFREHQTRTYHWMQESHLVQQNRLQCASPVSAAVACA